MSTLLEEEKEGADSEYSDTITGSEPVIAGGIQKKAGDRRFTCFGNDQGCNSIGLRVNMVP